LVSIATSKKKRKKTPDFYIGFSVCNHHAGVISPKGEIKNKIEKKKVGSNRHKLEN
jgi:hypothetical protein